MLKLGNKQTKFSLNPELISYLILGFVIFIFSFWRLNSLVAGANADELNQQKLVTNLDSLKDNPINAPFKLFQHLANAIHPGMFSLRLVSAVVGALLILVFFKLLRGWFGRIIGLFGALFLASLPVFAISSRQASSVILLFSPLVIIFLYQRAIKSENNIYWILLGLLSIILVYTPGILWWLIGASLLGYKKIKKSVNAQSTLISSVVAICFCIGILPLIYSSFKNLGILKRLLLIPGTLPAPLTFLNRLLHMFLAIFVRSPQPNYLFIDHLPVLNILLLALVIFGAYAMWTAAKDKAFALILSIIYGILAAALNNNVTYLIFAIPALIIFATAGLRYLYVEWRTIFPRNPVPKTFALMLITAVALSQLFFCFHYTLLAWPHSSTTKSAYMLK